MVKGSLDQVLDQLHQLVGADQLKELSDRELLERFVLQREESAFVSLVWRHGPLVRGLCRRVLRHEQDAEDAFQATFLTLARKAGAISKKEALASWLYKVAFRIASRARSKNAPLTNRPPLEAMNALDDPHHSAARQDLCDIVDEEIARLPERYGKAIILCYLQEKSHEEAARLLGCPKGTLAAWVARARDRLCQRLTRRGCVLSAGGAALVVTEAVRAAPVSAELARATAHASLAYLSGAGGAALSPQAVALAEGVLRMMWLNQLKRFAVIFLLVSTLSVGTGWLALNAWANGGAEDVGPPAAAQAKQKGEPPPQGDPEIAKLRSEIGKLREELAVALREIKDLKDALRKEAAADEGPLYRGKSVRFWLAQHKDADAKFRTEAVEALGHLASKKNKEVIAALLASIRDERYEVASAASTAVGRVGREVVPPLIEILKDKTAAKAHRFAIDALAWTGADAKPAVPLLIEALKGNDRSTHRAAANTLGVIGPDAKPAIPVLVASFETHLNEYLAASGVDKTSKFGGAFREALMPGVILDALLRIDPDLKGALSNAPRSENIGGNWQSYLAIMKKKYAPEK